MRDSISGFANSRLAVFCALSAVLAISSYAGAQVIPDLSPPPIVRGAPGDTITIPLNLSRTTLQGNYSLNFIFPRSLLAFLRTDSTGTVTEAWEKSSGRLAAADTIAISGFISTGGPFDVEGVLIKVIFRVEDGASGSGELQLRNFERDLANATTRDGVFQVSLNTPPVLDRIANQAMNEGAIMDVPVTAADPDGDGITLSGCAKLNWY